MKFILGQKVEMTQIFKEDGDVVPVTVVLALPSRVVQVKTAQGKDGYNAVKIGLPGKKKLSKTALGQLCKLGNLQYIREFRTEGQSDFQKGDTITVGTFNVGDKVKIIGISKGKGFQGVVKRHGFSGQKATHGDKDQERAHGSIGSSEPARVFPGIKMPGHMGNAQVTIKNLEIVRVDIENSKLYIKGAVPGARNGLLLISG
ncbi:50S ribosomal protein L3 [Candidatus Kuenenbacteria bacterium CG11_big_fil_rev_8_21_14_0_20_37_9]|uniref:Large ribosomal subunit protein uL3 n=2 Tax=Candidatus Kueneniibacteriota TaxID=1752740 RepID=A0A2M6XRQ7_9BACT|nr:MAG: 50S ribosomal protein L3 [Candidatus Kuenenbacteria bacterium CG1_02_38_13]PIR05822.1 MAG: 50S ribosomal protein L3 [Candidatus Kuenenbacteria bacterium CG11_big_fil_rev_8_21_14_0_20_37_9]PIU10335.1 MAG: 50S ribosomal protein L3 [Candidatus Kuenenbacteria bacterium CG08_land_8_20_14_0_20_37_23]